jgi:asparagine synthase (glutamine-hydrolysing)
LRSFNKNEFLVAALSLKKFSTMCGIGGIFLKNKGKITLEYYLQEMFQIHRHRGPDSEGLWISKDQRVGLCHNRLAILDLSAAGDQPMHSTDQRFTIVFNGEIYNYLELQKQLISNGCEFRTHSDTEVLLEAYRHWGEGMLAKLRGMFSFALYDHADGSLFCARDRVGKKPFVYAQTQQGFIFASEIPAVCQVTGVDTTHDLDAIAAMLLHNLRHIPDPHTAYRGIKRLRAGHAMRIRQGVIEKIWRYWTPTPSTQPITSEQLRATLEESIALRMRADVPVGALLSGGVDSSAIVAMMQQHSTKPIHTYALGFDQDDEDLRRARQMARHLGTRHKEYYFDPDEQWQIFNHLIGIYGEPIMLLPLVHTFSLCRAIRDDGIKVVMSGNGADELFYGYTGHIRTLKISRWLDRLSVMRPLFSLLAGGRFAVLSAPPGKRKAALYKALANNEWGRLFTKEAKRHFTNRAAEEMEYWGDLCPSKQFIDESNFVGLMVENPHSVTIAGDLPAMAASIEMRSPFLDQEVVSFALATPVEQKIPSPHNPAWLKAILRDAVSDLIPQDLLIAPKRGFGMSIQEAMVLNGPWKGHADEMFSSPKDIYGLIELSELRRVWSRYKAGDGRDVSLIAKALAIQTWARGEAH